MNKGKKTIQEAIERIHSGRHPEGTVKKRKISRIILLVDVVFVLLILVFIYNRAPEKLYYSTSINYSNVQYRFSMTRETREKKYLFSLTVKNNLNQVKRVSFNNSLSELAIYYGREEIYRTKIGENITELKLLPGELKTFISKIDNSILEKYFSEHPEYITSEKRTLFSRSKDYTPLIALLTINLREKISTSLNFHHEAE